MELIDTGQRDPAVWRSDVVYNRTTTFPAGGDMPPDYFGSERVLFYYHSLVRTCAAVAVSRVAPLRWLWSQHALAAFFNRTCRLAASRSAHADQCPCATTMPLRLGGPLPLPPLPAPFVLARRLIR